MSITNTADPIQRYRDAVAAVQAAIVTQEQASAALNAADIALSTAMRERDQAQRAMLDHVLSIDSQPAGVSPQ